MNSEKDQDDSNSNEKESTEHEETATSSTPPPQVVYHSDVCSICMDNVSLMDPATYFVHQCCGKVIHDVCENDLYASKLSDETKNSCPMCRAKNAPGEGSEEDIRRLCKWSQKNKRWAQEMLGRRYAQGVGVPQDDKRACVLYKLAADQGHHHAQYNLGIMYAAGRGVNQSDSLAFKYYQLAAIQGLANAQCNVGAYYYNGIGVEQSDTEAREWWKKAAAQGSEEAIQNLQMMDKRGL